MDDTTIELNINFSECRIMRNCIICGNGFMLRSSSDPRLLCKTCLKALKELVQNHKSNWGNG